MAAEPFAFPALEAEGRVVSGGTPQSRAAEIIGQAQAEARRILAAAEEEGREAGYAAGVEQARAELEPVRMALEEAIRGLSEERDAFLERGEKWAVELALALADKIVVTALNADPELVLEVVTGALRRAAERDQIVIEVNPQDIELVRENAAAIASRLGGISQLEVVADRRVGRGGCVIRTAEGEVDGRIFEQLHRAEELLREALAAGRADA